jgi:hypothetical protein
VSKELDVRILDPAEYDEWDRLVESSPAGTVYNTSWWAVAMAQITGARTEIIGCFLGGALCGGCAASITRWGPRDRVMAPPTTPYNGFVLREPATPSYRRRLLHYLDVSTVLAEFMESRYDEIRLRHHYTYADVRGLLWRGWESEVYYTYVVDVSNEDDLLTRSSSSIRRTVKQARDSGLVVEISEDIKAFAPLYQRTYGKHGLRAPLRADDLCALYRVARDHSAATLFLTRDRSGQALSGLIQLSIGDRTNTWVLASDPDYLSSGAAILTQMHSFQHPPADTTFIDEASANLPSLHESEIKLGAELRPILEVYFSRSLLLAARYSLLTGWNAMRRQKMQRDGE